MNSNQHLQSNIQHALKTTTTVPKNATLHGSTKQHGSVTHTSTSPCEPMHLHTP